jgi:hypothetical protein
MALARFLHLSTTEKILILKSFLVVLAIRVVLWVVPVELIRGLSPWNSAEKNAAGQSDWHEITSIVRAVKAVSRFVPRATCLTQALAASWLIRRHGQSSDLVIGVAKDDRSRLIAHAWLEKDGRIILGKHPEQGRFVPLSTDSVVIQ